MHLDDPRGFLTMKTERNPYTAKAAEMLAVECERYDKWGAEFYRKGTYDETTPVLVLSRVLREADAKSSEPDKDQNPISAGGLSGRSTEGVTAPTNLPTDLIRKFVENARNWLDGREQHAKPGWMVAQLPALEVALNKKNKPDFTTAWPKVKNADGVERTLPEWLEWKITRWSERGEQTLEAKAYLDTLQPPPEPDPLLLKAQEIAGCFNREFDQWPGAKNRVMAILRDVQGGR